VLLGIGYARAATWTTIDSGSADGSSTALYGIDGRNVVGVSVDRLGRSSCFVYQIGNGGYSFQAPGPYPGIIPSGIYGIDGSNLVGFYGGGGPFGNSSFLYNGTTWTFPYFPGASDTTIYGIDGDNLVGSTSGPHGFLYNGSSWTTLDKPGASHTVIYGIDGSNLVGEYDGHGFLYNGTNWTTLDMGASQTFIRGIDGSNLVGWYGDGPDYHGFLYNGTTWTTLDYPGARTTWAYGISGSNIVGCYEDTSGVAHGFVYNVPEPATVLLLGLGVVMVRKKR
jgi:hypothetical protein